MPKREPTRGSKIVSALEVYLQARAEARSNYAKVGSEQARDVTRSRQAADELARAIDEAFCVDRG